jgi:hypothetical protein
MFWTSSHGEVREGPGPSEGTFSYFFSGSVRAPNRFPTLVTRGRPGWGIAITDRDLGIDRERIRETRHRSSSRASWTLARMPTSSVCDRRSRRSSTSRLRHGIRTTMSSTPIADRTSQHLLTIFDRSERSRTSFDARGNFPRARSIPRSLRDRVRPRKLGHVRSRERHEQLRSNPFDLRTSPRVRSEKISADRIDELQGSHPFFSCI